MATISSTFSPNAWLSSTSNLSHHNKREAENILTEEQCSNDKETRNNQIQKNEKRQLNASQDKKFAISAINSADVTGIQSVKNIETFLRTSSQPINFTLPATEAPFFYSVAYQEQNRLLYSLLIQEGYTIDPHEDGTLSYRLVNHISDYLSHNENTEAKQATLAKRLLKPLGEYGAGEGEKISSSRQRGVIAKWLQRAVLGLPSDKWILLQLEAAITLNMGKIKDNRLLDHQYLKQKFFQQLKSSNGLAILSPQARTYYQENVLSRVMPTFCLQLKDPDEQIRLESMMVNQPAWGYLHAGAMLLSESGAELNQMSLDDIINTGVLLQTLIVERKLPAEYAHYFKLPALIHQQLKPEYMTDSVEINEQTMSSIYRHYFNELEQANQNNPFFKLNNLLQNWKSRP
ncbi:hypothetical protein WH390_01120 [Candidatus Arsenophonus nilaparvatae]|uniref:hypothetical protein n=1 Tax=Candidatus Arsenophonus nilaparvatae TaxID=1247023 RepID=UPI000509E7FB|nr:hypothetical protein [Candidatus Arsenophonus nilaparvatae]